MDRVLGVGDAGPSALFVGGATFANISLDAADVPVKRVGRVHER